MDIAKRLMKSPRAQYRINHIVSSKYFPLLITT